MKTKADAFFEDANFLEATPLYLRLLSLKPRDFDYNYRYGTCLLFNSNAKKDAIKHLNYAVSSPSAVPETYFYLAKAYHLNYQFGEAIKFYEKYISLQSKPSKKMDAAREIEMCQNGKQLLTTLTDIIVQDKKEIANDKFFRVYDLNEKMTAERAKANNLEHADQKAAAYCNKVKPMFDDIRECCDEIERVCDDAEWTLPKYRELLSLS